MGLYDDIMNGQFPVPISPLEGIPLDVLHVSVPVPNYPRTEQKHLLGVAIPPFLNVLQDAFW